MKKIIPALALAFVISFTLFIYEPITMYANNIDDFWFDLRLIIIPVIKIFIVSFIALSAVFTLIYLINKKFLKNNNFYNIILIIAFIVFMASYIQGNFLIGNLPPLDGTKFDWDKYRIDNIITIIIWLAIITIYIITIMKFKFDKVINVSKYVTLVIFGMLSASLLSTILTTKNIFIKKEVYNLTIDNINKASTNKNFFIFLVDAVDSKTFDKVLNKSEYKNTFEDFTYYPDTLAGYPFTRDSIPLILTGKWNENETDFISYNNDAMDNSKLIENLKEKNYDINIYEQDTNWSTSKMKELSNAENLNKKGITTYNALKQEIKYILFKYLPYKFKKYSQIETLEYVKGDDLTKNFKWDDTSNYNRIKNNKLEKIENKYFQFMHIEGGHSPFNLDEKLNKIENGTYEQKLNATLKVINAFINRLKENDVYDNSVIIVLSDHGYNTNGKIEGRQNPILYIKGLNEHHKMNTSDKPISYEDLIDAYTDLLEGKKSTEMFSNISKTRTRRFLLYGYTKEDHMVEYETKGKAWDTDAMYKTGKEFNR